MSQDAFRRFAVVAATLFLAACNSTPGGLVALDGGDDSGSDAFVTPPDAGDTGSVVRDAAKPDGGCADGVKDSDETDVDCGGTTCGACPAGEMCLKNSDCQSAICTAGVCQQQPPPQQCQTAADCPGADTLCQTATCVSHGCVYTPAAAGTACDDDGGSKCDGSGHCIACTTASDCPAQASACLINACVTGSCVANAATSGTACTDSGGTECNGSGKCVAQCSSAADCPASTTACAAPACTGGLCGSTDATEGTLCTDSGGSVCNGTGACVACNTPADCPEPTNPCLVDTCTAGVCGTTNAAMGAVCTGSGSVCNGSGACVACNTPSDCPLQPNACTTNVCTAGVCSTTNASSGTSCGGGTLVCDGSGSCVGCNQPSDCPPSPTLCQTLTCTAGTCGTSDAASGTTCTDSGGSLCNASGACVECNAASDCPAQTTTCKTNTCTAGTCGTSDATSGTTCNDNGGTTCDGSGMCVACNSAADCPATGNFCIAPACTANVCGTTDLGPSNVLPTGQTPGDCQELVCDGNGGFTSVDDPTDLPSPSTACETDPACAGSPLSPSFTDAPTGTSCTADNHPPNQVCGDTTNSNIAGTCVECNTNADCVAAGLGTSMTCDTSTGTCQ